MSELQNRASGKVIMVHGPFAYATLIDFKQGVGLLQIYSDWGTYSSFWGAMGNRTLAQFLAAADSQYIETNLAHGLHQMGFKQSAFVRLSKFMAHCWPRILEEIKKDLAAPVVHPPADDGGGDREGRN